MSSLVRLAPVIPATSQGKSSLQAYISVVNYYENALFVLTIAQNEEEAQKFIEEALAKAYEKDSKNPGSYAQPGRFDSWWKRKHSSEFNPLYEISLSEPGVYFFKGPDVNNNFR